MADNTTAGGPGAAGLKQAIQLYNRSNHAESNRLLLRLERTLGVNPIRCLWIGRNFIAERNFQEAVKWLSKPVENERVLPAYFELALAESRCRDHTSACEHLLRFMNAGKGDKSDRGISEDQSQIILEIADAAFSEIPDLAVKVYETAADIGVSSYLSRLRVILALIGAGALDDAFKAITALRDDFPLDGAGLLALGRLRALRGRKTPAGEALARAVAKEPENLQVLLGAAECWLELDDHEEAAKLLDTVSRQAAKLDPVDTGRYLDAELQLSRWAGGRDRLVSLFAKFEFGALGEKVERPVLDVAQKMRKVVEDGFAGELLEVTGLLRFYSRQRMEPEAEIFLKKIEPLDVFKDRLVALRRLDLFCVMIDLDRAEVVYREFFKDRPLTRGEFSPVIRFLSERKLWDEAADVFVRDLAERRDIVAAPHQLLRVVRKSGTRDLVLAKFDELMSDSGKGVSNSALEFRQLLIDDQCIEIGGPSAPSTPEYERRLSEDNCVLSSLEVDASVELKGRTAMFMCTDKAYFFGVLTFLASYALNNSAYADKVTVIVFLADDVPLDWDVFLADFGDRIRQPIQVMRERDFIIGESTQHGSWGFFSGGAGLSRAAYFRLYAAKHLQGLGRFDRLCYIDSDIICQGDLGELFAFDLGGHLLAARIEDAGPQVEFAAQRNAIDPKTYFNSGVLLFDISNEETTRRLDQAIYLGENEPHRLYFLDQCALNIAYREDFSPLPAPFNFFLNRVRPDRDKARLLHYVASPKPWDISYDKEPRDAWLRAAEVVRVLLTPGDYHRVVLAANGR